MTEPLNAARTLWDDVTIGKWRHGDQHRLVALPHASAPRQILPWHWSTVLATSSRRHDDLSRLRHLRNTVGAAGLLTLGALPARRRLSVGSGDSVVSDILSRLGLDGEVHVIAFCGPARANQKPILHLHDHRGRALAFVKVAWNDLTRRLLDDEHEALIHLSKGRTDAFVTPSVMCRGSVGDAEWLAISPVAVQRRRTPSSSSVDALALAIQATGVNSSERTAGSNFVKQLTTRVADLSMAGDVVPRLVERHGDLALQCGASHGDFVPWNIQTGHPESAVWDWERYRTEAPVGFDRLHFRVQVALLRQGIPLPRLLRVLRSNLHEALPEIPEVQRNAHLDWYVADLLGRYEGDALDHSSDRLTSWASELHHHLEERLK